MVGKFILDTNIIIALLKNDKYIHSHIKTTDEIFVPCIAVGELYYGAFKSTKVETNLQQINQFVIKNTVLPCNSETSKMYGEIKNTLKRIGKPLPENDIWIAALAKQHSLILVTRDTHFSIVDGLNTEDWV